MSTSHSSSSATPRITAAAAPGVVVLNRKRGGTEDDHHHLEEDDALDLQQNQRQNRSSSSNVLGGLSASLSLQDYHNNTTDPVSGGSGSSRITTNANDNRKTAYKDDEDNSSSTSSEDDYHSPLEDADHHQHNELQDEDDDVPNNQKMTTASPYDYDVNWDMVGHSRTTTQNDDDDDDECDDDDDDADEQQTQQQQQLQSQGARSISVHNSKMTSLADTAAASSIIASTASAATGAAATTPTATNVSNATTTTTTTRQLQDNPPMAALPLPPPPFSFRRSLSGQTRHHSYRYQKYSDPDDDVDLHSSTAADSMTLLMDDNELEMNASVEEPVVSHYTEDATDMVNVDATSTSSASTTSTPSSSMAHRATTTAARRRRHGRASSFHSSPTRSSTATTSTIPRPPVVPEEDFSSSSSRTSYYSSLDSGMAAVRRWIRARTTSSAAAAATASAGGGVGSSSSRAARRWQREAAATTMTTTSNNSVSTTTNLSLQLGEEDLFALTHAGRPPHRSFMRNDFSIILEEEDHEHLIMGGGSGGGGAVRQRALSEPNNDRMRNFFFQRAAHGPSFFSSNRSSTVPRGTAPSFGGSSHHHRRRREQPSQAAASLEDELSTRSSGPNAAASAAAMTTSISVPAHLSSAALNSSLFHSPQRGAGIGSGSGVMSDDVMVLADQRTTSMHDGDVSSLAETTSVPPSTITMMSPTSGDDDDDPDAEEDDPNRDARMRWIRINRRFQLIITVVALIFSLLLFAILVCWVVFTSAYVVSIDKQCDVPLKQYFWLATLQLILDVFRTDIMRFIFRWDTHSNDQIPVRVIMYNIAYLIYALLVLRLGVKSVFKAEDSTCPTTAPELYQSSAVFVSLSLAAWSTIVLGYLVPFCFVATLLTWNGYTPTADNQEQNPTGAFIGGVFPAAYTTSAAPPGCVDQLRTVLLEEFPDNYPRECCICMGDFVTGDVIVATECQHVFHKRCCEEWLRQARTCPVCRTDIPSSLNLSISGETEPEVLPAPPPPASRLTRPFPGREDFHQDVVGLLQILRRQETRLRQRPSSSEDDAAVDPSSTNTLEQHSNVVSSSSTSQHNEDGTATPTAGVVVLPARSESFPVVSSRETEMVALEEGHVGTNRQHSS